MAFFGLTALGMQNPFAASADVINHYTVFTDEDFKRAFNAEKRSSASGFSITVEQLAPLMERVYMGAVPPSELALLTRHVEKLTPKRKDIYWHDFLEAVRSARREAEERSKKEELHMGPACETDSWWEYQSNIRKCKSSKRAPPEKFIYPLTAQQEIGWEPPSFGPRKAKTSSEETRFASEMIRFGVTY